jgi:membrane associated rhomboid family serine protease
MGLAGELGMGIYDREYYRKDGPSFLGSISSPGQACKWLIIINAVVFGVQLLTQERSYFGEDTAGPFTEAFWLDVTAVLHGQVWRLLTYAFLHDPTTWMHVVFNMLFLWWFGSDVEELYGTREFLTFYLVAAFVGGVFFVIANQLGIRGEVCLGASGAVTAAMVLCACHFPYRVIYLFFFLPIPIWVFILIQLAPDAYQFLIALRHSDATTGHTAVAVHLAGAAFAFVYYQRNWRLSPLWTQLRGWQKQRRRPALRVYREEPVPAPAAVRESSASGDIDEQMEAKVDAVLEKVARSGQDSLTDNERQILLRASEVYKRRRT